MNIHERLGGNNARRLSPRAREFYIDGVTYPSSASDIQSTGIVLYTGEFTKVSVKKHGPSSKEIIEKKIRKKDNRKKYVDIEKDMINISHSEYIVKYFGYLEDQVDLFLYMEKMACCFRQLLDRVTEQNTPFPPLLLHTAAFSVVKALTFLKRHNILHRDIKPSNILLNEKGEIKLSDFGLSKECEDGTANSKGIGTYEYNAPERLGPDKKNHSYPSDLWSLGITLHELACREHPIRKEATAEDGTCTKFELMIVVTQSDPPQLFTDQIDSPHFCDFVNRCLQKNPEDRIPLENIFQHPVFSQKFTEQEVKDWFEPQRK
ncbi:hypothetical protein ACHWQZ_G014173 [Mnemiopsis leidyi]